MFPAILTNGYSIEKTEWLTLEEYQHRHSVTKNCSSTWCLHFDCTVWDFENRQYLVYWDGQFLGTIKMEYLGNSVYRYHSESSAFNSLPEAVASYFES